MDSLHKGWFTEFSPDDLARIRREKNEAKNSSTNEPDNKLMKVDGVELCGGWTGQAFSLQVDEVLFEGKSKYQDVLVFKSKTYGNVLVLDGVIQTTDRDEFAYQEMLAHLPLFAHPNPKKVLIIGGGDGGILREVLKHECVESVVMCEIDDIVIEVSKKFLPNLSSGYSNPRLSLLHVGDGFEFLKKHKNKFDVVITDSSDPVGPAESLFGKSYYELIKDALREGGVLSSQAECAWLHLPLIARVMEFTRALFLSVQYGYASMPTYPSGSMGYLLASKSARDLTTPVREPDDKFSLKFYNPQVHKAAFALPNFVAKALAPVHE